MPFTRLLFPVILFFSLSVANGQLLSWTPAFPTDTTTSFAITMDADKGNRGLLNYPALSDVYVHTGVITNMSATPTDWKYVKFNQNFSQPNAQLQAAFIGNNKWRFTLSGSIRNYYGVPAGETILKVAILFRSGNGALVQRNSDGSDMYVPVYGNSLAGRITSPFRQPMFNPVPENLSFQQGDTVAFSGAANRNASLTLFFNGAQVAFAGSASSISAVPAPVITGGGNQSLVLRVQSGAETVFDTVRFYVPGPGVIAPLPAGVKDGINYEAGDTSATLVLFAPGKQRVCIIGDLPGSDWEEKQQYQMNKTPDGKYWWLRITGLAPTNEYSFQYLIDGNLRVADPYVEKVLDPWNDRFIPPATYPGLKPYPSAFTQNVVGILQTAPSRYNWTTAGYQRPDKRKLVIYELLLRDFITAHSWNVLTDTLNYLKRLGVNAIQLMPFNEFEGNISWGYNPSFYFAPDKYYGRANDLRRFIDICHSNGIAVIMDIALNHSFGLSPMVRMYWDEVNNRPSSTNPWYNPVAKHGFNVGYDFNHESEATRYFVSRVLTHWLTEYRLDGFRFDLSKGFTQRQTCDNNGNNCDVAAWGAYDQSRIDILNRYYDSMQAYVPGSYAILEHFADNSEETVLASKGFLLWGNMNYNYSQASMGYANGADISYGLHTTRGWSQPHLITYMESHDEERTNYRNINNGNSAAVYNIRDSNVAMRRMELAHVFLLTLPGPKMIWQFGELGYSFPINYCENGSINTTCRTDPKPIRWDYAGELRRKSIYNLFDNLMRLRSNASFSNLFVNGSITAGLSGLEKWIKLSDSTGAGMLAIGNFDVVARAVSVSFPSPGVWYNYLNPPDSLTSSGGNLVFNLQPGEYRVYLNRFLPIPGTVINFTGTNNGFVNLLQWKVLEEAEVSGYELQRSIDSVSFVSVRQENKNATGNYSYNDDISVLSSNRFFYRVKVNFSDGSFRYSKIIRIERPSDPAGDFSVTLAPNPFAGIPVLRISSPSAQRAFISVYDMTGRLLLKNESSIGQGMNVLPLSAAAAFSSGSYRVRVVAGNESALIHAVKCD